MSFGFFEVGFVSFGVGLTCTPGLPRVSLDTFLTSSFTNG